MATEDIHYMELSEVGEKIRTGALTSTGVTNHMLDRIAGPGDRLNAFITVTAEIAREQAAEVDAEIAAGNHKGPLHGVPIALKDVCDMEGVPTTAAMPLRRDHVADSDATVTRRLKDAGAVILGKLNMAEGAYAQHPAPYNWMINPWDETVYPGASSGGSGVATAAGLAFGTIATDTGGSIRIPSASNGATGLKPTWGRVSRHGIFELAATLDHVGPICRSARDAGIMLEAIAGADPHDPTAALRDVPDLTTDKGTDLKGLRIGLDEKWITEKVQSDSSNGVFATCEVLRSLGAEIVPMTFPDRDQIIWDWFEVCGPQTAYAHRETYPKFKDQYTDVLGGQIQQGLDMSAVQYQEVLLRREAFTGRVQALFQSVDLLICPAIGCRVPTLEEVGNIDNDMIYDLHRFTCTFTMSRNPTITFPCGNGSTKIPIVAQLVGPHFGEDVLVRTACAFQTATDWHKRHPKI